MSDPLAVPPVVGSGGSDGAAETAASRTVRNPSLDEILRRTLAEMDAPLLPAKPLSCPKHGPDHLQPMKGCPAQECMAPVEIDGYTISCRIKPCHRCGNDKGSWMSNTCDICYSAIMREQERFKAERRADRNASEGLAKQVAVALEQENAHLRALLHNLLDDLYQHADGNIGYGCWALHERWARFVTESEGEASHAS